MTIPNFSDEEWTDSRLDELAEAVRVEVQKRTTRARAEEVINAELQKLGQALGRIAGGKWVQPTGAHDAYAKGEVVTHEGIQYESTVVANVWEPGVSGWRALVVEDPETGEVMVPEWAQPTGAHDVYGSGDRVTFEGAIYESTIPNNSWSPSAYPGGWKLIAEGV